MGNSAGTSKKSAKDGNIFNFTVDNLDNEPVEMNKFRGSKAYVLVNTASAWGLAKVNFSELQTLHDKYG